MSKFKVVTEAPTNLEKGEYVVDVPNFLAEIDKNKTKFPKNGLTGAFQLRMILDSIAQTYDPENMTAYSAKVHHFEGRPYSNDEELNAIVVEMLQRDYPAVFAKYVETKLRQRPNGTKLVYYVDSGLQGGREIFYKNGLSEETED